MKKTNIILLLLVGILLVSSCETEDRGPVISGEPVLPAWIGPVTGGDYILTEDEADDAMATFQWSAAYFGFQGAVTYILQMDDAGNSFADAVDLANTTTQSVSITVGDMNQELIAMGKDPNTSYSFDIRVVAAVHADVDTIYSSSISMDITPYESALSIPPVYMLGSGTRPGWDNAAAREMIYLGDGKYFLIDSLFAGGDNWLKFIAELGKWAPQWGDDGTGDWASGGLAYRPTEGDPDPPAIPAPPVSGVYKVTFDMDNLTYTVEASGLFMLGDATTAGWDNANPLPMMCVETNQFELTTTLTSSLYFKFIDTPGQWAPMWGTDDQGTSTGGNLVYRPTEGSPDPPAIPAGPPTGSYKVEANIKDLTYVVTTAK